MDRLVLLRQERDKIMTLISADTGNRAKWLTALMDIDDEIEELTSGTKLMLKRTNYKKERTA